MATGAADFPPIVIEERTIQTMPARAINATTIAAINTGDAFRLAPTTSDDPGSAANGTEAYRGGVKDSTGEISAYGCGAARCVGGGAGALSRITAGGPWTGNIGGA